MIQTWEREITRGTSAPTPFLSPSQGNGLQHQTTLKAKAPAFVLVFSISFLVQIPRSQSQVNSRLLRTVLPFLVAFCGPLGPAWVWGIPGQNPVATHLLGRNSCIVHDPRLRGTLGCSGFPIFRCHYFTNAKEQILVVELCFRRDIRGCDYCLAFQAEK